MARVQFPTVFPAEYRGQEAASSFTNRQTGEIIDRPPVLKFERTMVDDQGGEDVMPVQITLRDELLKAIDFDPRAIKRGEMVMVHGEVVCWTGKAGGGYFFEPTSLSVKEAKRLSAVPAAA